MNARRETNALRRIFTFPLLTAALPRPITIGGYDEMQGYPGDAYDETIGQFLARTGQMPGRQPFGRAPAPFAPRPGAAWGGGMQRPLPPPPPRLQPGQVQAGQSQPGTLLSYMGLGAHTFLTGAATSQIFDVEPQSAFRGRRLVIDVAKTSGAAGILVTVSGALTVSGMPQTPNPTQPAPAGMFSADATYSMLDLQIATSGTSINLTVQVSAAPASGESVSVSAGLYGEWIR